MKLHLPKMLLTAVIAGLVTSAPTYATTTGWGNSNNQPGDYYFIDKTDAVTINAGDKTNSRISIVADVASLNATASVTLKEFDTLAVCQNPWPAYHVFNSLVLTEIKAGSDGSSSFNLEVLNNAKVTINSVIGTVSSVTNNGTLTIGTADSTTALSGTITNTGTLTLQGTFNFAADGNYTVCEEKSEFGGYTDGENGFRVYGKTAYYLVKGDVTFDGSMYMGETELQVETLNENDLKGMIYTTEGSQSVEYYVNTKASSSDGTTTYVLTSDESELVVNGTLSNSQVQLDSGKVSVSGTNVLHIDTAAENVHQLLTTTTGDGIIKLSTNAQLNSPETGSDATVGTGTLIIDNAKLTFGSSDLNSKADKALIGADISSFNQVKLNNGHIYVNNPAGTIKNLTVTSEGGTFEVYDMGQPGDNKVFSFIETTTLNGNLTIKSQYNAQLSFSKLAGTKDIVIDDDARDAMVVSILDKDAGYTGKVLVKQTADNLTINVVENKGLDVKYTTTAGTMNLTNIGKGNTVILDGVTSAFASGDIAADIEFSGGTTKITSANDNKTVTMKGAVSGSAFLCIESTIPEDATAENNYKADTYKFTGDTSKWTGKLIAGNNAYTNVVYDGTKTINNEIDATMGATMNATIVNDSGVTVAAQVNQKPWNEEGGTVNLTVNNKSAESAGTVSFSETVQVSSTTLGTEVAVALSKDSSLGALTLGAGATVTGSGNLTLSSLSIDLTTYTTSYDQPIDLVSTTGTLNFTGSLDNYLQISVGEGKYTASITQTENALTLNFTANPPQGGLLTTTVTDYELLGGVLTLTVGDPMADYSEFNIIGFADGLLDRLRAEAGLPANGMVTLQLTDGSIESPVVGTDTLNVGFYGAYYGENVGGAWQYNVAYIPEPTTATLSLLALCGLAARRRRK